MAKSDSLVVEVPSTSRTRASSADQALIGRMASEVDKGTWVTNGKIYKTYKAASNASQVHRRALAASKNLATHQVKSRIWGLNGDVVVTDKNATADWKFALTLDPERQKRRNNRTK